MSVNISDLEINPRIVSAVKRSISSAESVLSLSGAEVERLTGLTSSDVTQLKDAVSEALLTKPPHMTALELLRQECAGQPSILKLSTGCPILDRHLRGGILSRGLTEIVGESAAGKTQLCLQLCLTVQLPTAEKGLGGGAVYICTEDAFPSKRMQQMALHFSQSHNGARHKYTSAQQFSDHIFVEHVADFDGLDVCLKKKLPLLLTRRMVKLVVIDSVAALFRCHYEHNNLVARAKHLASLATCLHRFSDRYSIPVVCVNQVSANMSDTADKSSSTRQFAPALGLVWADHVTCRFLLSRKGHFTSPAFLCSKDSDISEDLSAQLESGSVSARQFEVMFAPHLPPLSVPLLITSSGISCPG